MNLRLTLMAADAGGERGLASWGARSILDGLARALRDQHHEVLAGAGGEPADALIALVTDPAWQPPPPLREGVRLSACWLLGGHVPDAGRLTGFGLVAAPTGHLRSRLRRDRAVPSEALFTIPVAAIEPTSLVANRRPDPYRVAFLGYGEGDLPALRALAEALRTCDPRFRADLLAVGPPPVSAADEILPVVRLASLEGALERLPAYGVVVVGPSPIGLADVGLLAARRAGVIAITPGAPPGRDEVVLHEYDGFVSDEPGATPRFVEECIRRITTLAADPDRAAVLGDRARRAAGGWDEVASLWVRACERRLPPAGTRAAPPRVTVVMSARDVEPFVEDAVDSILAQTFWDFDLVVVDDGSRDRTAEILRGVDDPRLVVIQQPNRGVWAALNEGLRRARGELVARMDADDLSHPRRLALQVEFLDRHPHVGLLGTGFYKVDRSGRIQLLVQYPTEDGALKRQLTRETAFLHPTVVFRRRVLDRTGPYRPHEAEDYDLWLRMSERVAVANLEAPLHRLRRTGETRVARFEREIIASAEELRRQALQRCLGGQDPGGYPSLRRPRWLGLPDLRPEEIGPYLETLHVWAEEVASTRPAVAARLYGRAILTRPWQPRAWRALARSLIIGQPVLHRPLSWLKRRLPLSR